MVNDVGADLDGSGGDAGPAEAVAAEVVSAGGWGLADTTDVASIDGGRRAVARAIDACGRHRHRRQQRRLRPRRRRRHPTRSRPSSTPSSAST